MRHCHPSSRPLQATSSRRCPCWSPFGAHSLAPAFIRCCYRARPLSPPDRSLDGCFRPASIAHRPSHHPFDVPHHRLTFLSQRDPLAILAPSPTSLLRADIDRPGRPRWCRCSQESGWSPRPVERPPKGSERCLQPAPPKPRAAHLWASCAVSRPPHERGLVLSPTDAQGPHLRRSLFLDLPPLADHSAGTASMRPDHIDATYQKVPPKEATCKLLTFRVPRSNPLTCWQTLGSNKV